MIQIFHNVNIDWLAHRGKFIALSVLLLLAGLASAVIRQAVPGGTEAFNLGVDFKGGTVVTVKFRQRPSSEQIRAALAAKGVRDATVQEDANKPDEVLIRLPLQNPTAAEANEQAAREQVDVGRNLVREALKTFGPEAEKDVAQEPQAAFRIEGTDQVGPVAGRQLRNQAVVVSLMALVGILIYIALRFELTYGIAAVLAVFHDVLITLGFFSIFQWEVNLTVIAALLTLIGFSVNDTIVSFDRMRENLRINRRTTLYQLANDAINQTLSRTVITGGLVFLSVLALVLFGGEVLRPFSLALFIGIIVGTYSTIAIASPIMVWWQQQLEKGRTRARAATAKQTGTQTGRGQTAAAARAGRG